MLEPSNNGDAGARKEKLFSNLMHPCKISFWLQIYGVLDILAVERCCLVLYIRVQYQATNFTKKRKK